MNLAYRTSQPSPDFVALKAGTHQVWSTGNYARIGSSLQLVGEHLCEAMNVRAGGRLLDVAAGNGNVSLAAARRYCEVVSTDFVASLLEDGRARAEANGLVIEFREADAEELPFADGSFDQVASSFGVMFAPDQQRAAAELLRVCRSGGSIGLANWTPEGFIGEFFRTVSAFNPAPPRGQASPLRWGSESGLRELLGEGVASIRATRRHHNFRYRSAEHFIEMFLTYFGPTRKTFEALDVAGKAEFDRALRELLERRNEAIDGSLCIPGEYLEAVLIRG